MIVILDNACVNSSIFCTTDTDTASVHYFGESHMATRVCVGVCIGVCVYVRVYIM